MLFRDRPRHNGAAHPRGSWQKPVFRHRSRYEGIARGTIGRTDLVAHTIGVLTPGLSALGTGMLLPSFVGPGFWLSTIIGFGLMLLLASVFEEYSSRFSAAGSLYTAAAKSLGPVAGLLVGVTLLVGYSTQVGFGLTGGAERLVAAWTASGAGQAYGVLFWIVVVLCAFVCLAILLRGIRWSTRSVLLIEVVTFGFLVAVFGTWLLRYGLPDLEVFSLEGASPLRIMQGAAVIATLMIAFESSAMLGLESQKPMRSVPSAVRLSLLIMGSTFAVANVVGATGPIGAGLESYRWFGVGDDVSWADAALLVVLALSLLALALAAWAALARLLFAFAREGLMPTRFGQTDSRGVPRLGTWIVLPLSLAAPLTLWIATGGEEATSWRLVTATTPVMFLAYGCCAIALIPFLRQLDELHFRPAAVAAAAVIGCVGVAVAGFDRSPWVIIVLASVAIIAVGWFAILRVQGRLAGIGAHDEPLSYDVHPQEPHLEEARAED